MGGDDDDESAPDDDDDDNDDDGAPLEDCWTCCCKKRSLLTRSSWRRRSFAAVFCFRLDRVSKHTIFFLCVCTGTTESVVVGCSFVVVGVWVSGHCQSQVCCRRYDT